MVRQRSRETLSRDSPRAPRRCNVRGLMPYVRTRLGRWFYEERGKAKREGDPAILLLHGLLFDGGMWRAQVEPLSALGRVLIIDGSGHGKSEAPPRFTLEDHADALAIDAFN